MYNKDGELFINMRLLQVNSHVSHACLCQFFCGVKTFNLLLPTHNGSMSLYILAIGLKKS